MNFGCMVLSCISVGLNDGGTFGPGGFDLAGKLVLQEIPSISPLINSAEYTVRRRRGCEFGEGKALALIADMQRGMLPISKGGSSRSAPVLLEVSDSD